jgi:23S rRNA pseudouridine2604 synthase
LKTQLEGIQVNKFISASGFCSRREADEFIAQGRVTINKNVVGLGARVKAGDVVAVDGERIKNAALKQGIYMAFNKPEGITCTTDLNDKTNIISYINYPKRIFPIGRLDKDSEGLILLTNDGDIVNQILRSENEHEKEYIVTVDKPITGEFVKRMAGGMTILGEKTKPCIVRELGGRKFKIILTQGLNRQIRRMCEQLGYKVMTLKRIRIMNINLDDLPLGKWRTLSPPEMEKLMAKIRGFEIPERVKEKKEKIKYTRGT